MASAPGAGKPVGKHIGYNRYGNRLYQVGGQIDVYPRKQLAKLYSGQFPADAFVPWSKTIYDHKFEIDEQKVRTKHFVYRSHEGYDLEMYIDLPASGSGFPVLFISSVADGLLARPNGWKSFLNIWLLLG